MNTEIVKFQIACAFQMAEARIENGQEIEDCLRDLEQEIQTIVNGEVIYDQSGLAI